MSVLDDVMKLAASMPDTTGIAAQIRCARDVESWIRGLPPGPPAGSLFGVEVYVDPAMQPGEWKMLDRAGNVVARSPGEGRGEGGGR